MVVFPPPFIFAIISFNYKAIGDEFTKQVIVDYIFRRSIA